MKTLIQLKKSSLSLNDALVLSYILTNPGCRQSDIKHETALHPTVISQIVKKFVQARVLTEELQRTWVNLRLWAKVYQLTPSGRKLVQPFCYPDLVEDVTAFSKKIGLPVNDPDALTSTVEEQDALWKHLAEETKEFKDALRNFCRADQLDALVDLVYVAVRYSVALGMDFNEAWRRVQKANMQKVRVKSAEESKRGTKYDAKKPEGWTAPDLSDLV